MRIVFLCGCLEPGQDGVGDYTRRLAAELCRQGHQVKLIALYDRRIENASLLETQQEEEQLIPTLRLSNQLSWQERTARARTYIDTANPEWISLQYVPFSFHDKGLSTQLAGVIKQLGRGRSIHIMFHEIWLGLSKQAPRRHVAWGLLQRQLISLLLKACNHPVVHTHTPLYQLHLNGLNARASILPLFSNIPVADVPGRQKTTDQAHNDRIRFVLFGGIFPNAPIDQFAAEVVTYARKRQKEVDLTLVGRNGSEQATWVSACHTHGLSVHVLGEQSPEQISTILSESSIGLSTTPIALAGKSSAIATMHAHGLPVFCVAAPWHPRNRSLSIQSSGLTNYSAGQLEQTLNVQYTILPTHLPINEIAAQFAGSLT